MMKPNNIKKLSFYLAPCDKLPWGPYEVGQECIRDKEKQKEYLEKGKNEFHTFFIYNQETFDINGGETVRRVAKFEHTSNSYERPKQINYQFKEYQLIDQTDLFQLTKPEVEPFYRIFAKE